ncbi:hypothetical protein DBV15_05046 [Temnothorax longispinosus]|uniref:Uncharacterized protein n=1 Tax=Temnothorax longispinosus TaxID=300112 RepID=A0A4S2KV88_9HYME|nr:hypothetical protein DBV15_05046 [Temnothorax longispinosus]
MPDPTIYRTEYLLHVGMYVGYVLGIHLFTISLNTTTTSTTSYRCGCDKRQRGQEAMFHCVNVNLAVNEDDFFALNFSEDNTVIDTICHKIEDIDDRTCRQAAVIRSANFSKANTISSVIPVPLFPKKHVSCSLKAERPLAPLV